MASDSSSGESVSLIDEKQPLSSTGRSMRYGFTMEERKKMVDYIVTTNSYDELSGVKVWKRLEEKMKYHTWQSLKEHFMKKIIPLIHTYNLSKDKVDKLRLAAKSQNSKLRRRSYTNDEDNRILKYVKLYATRKTALSGNAFWKQMEKNKYVPGRTWSALRERYLKYLRNGDSASERRSISSGKAKTAESPPLAGPSTSAQATVSQYLSTPVQKRRSSLVENKSSNAKDELEELRDGRHTPILITSENSSDERGDGRDSPVLLTSEHSSDESSPGPYIQESRTTTRSAEEVPSTVGEPSTSAQAIVSSCIPSQVQKRGSSLVENKCSDTEDQQHEELKDCNVCPGVPTSDHSSDESSSRPCTQESQSQAFRNNFPPEEVVFISDPLPGCECGSDTDKTAPEDSEWSDNDAIMDRGGGVYFPEELSKKKHPSHLSLISPEEFHGQGKATAKKQQPTKRDHPASKEQDCLPEKRRDHQGTSSTTNAPQSGTSKDLPLSFAPQVENSFYDTQQSEAASITGFNVMETSADVTESQEQDHYVSDCLDTSIDSAGAVMEYVPSNNEMVQTKSVAVQTDPVMVLPVGWMESVGLPLDFAIEQHILSRASSDGCPSPVPGNSLFKSG